MLINKLVLIYTAVTPPVLVYWLSLTADPSTKAVSFSKRQPRVLEHVLLYIVSIAASVVLMWKYRMLYLPVSFGLYSTVMLVHETLKPLLHRYSGFRPAEVKLTLHEMAQSKSQVVNAVRSYYETSQFKVYDGGLLSYALVAVPPLRNHVGQKVLPIRIFVKAEPMGDNLEIYAEVDVRDYVSRLTWQNATTSSHATSLVDFLQYMYDVSWKYERPDKHAQAILTEEDSTARDLDAVMLEFHRLRLFAVELDNRFENTDEIEYPMFSIVKLVQHHPEYRDHFVEQFKLLVTGKLEGPYDLVPYCMRVLRFPEVQTEAAAHYKRLLETNNHPRYMNYFGLINSTYSNEEWDEAEMWPLYQKHFGN